MGSRSSFRGDGMGYMMASEPVTFQVEPPNSSCLDVFELVYFAQPYSIIDGISVNQSRENMGYKLADTINGFYFNVRSAKKIDVVIPIAETSNTSAPCVAARLKPFGQGFVKNRYFIMPGQTAREKGVRRKLNAMDDKFAGQNVLVDDSRVRGTTSREIVNMARKADARGGLFCQLGSPNYVSRPNMHMILC